jgi:hypothetical protein
MAKFEQRENSGVLFKNDKKEEGSKQPDYRGEANVFGDSVEVAGWLKEGAKGRFISLSFKVKEEYRPTDRDHGPDRDDDLIPF